MFYECKQTLELFTKLFSLGQLTYKVMDFTWADLLTLVSDQESISPYNTI